MVKRIILEEKEEQVEEKDENGNGNCLIPVLIEDINIWYDVKDKMYIAVAKIEGKRYKFEEIKD